MKRLAAVLLVVMGVAIHAIAIPAAPTLRSPETVGARLKTAVRGNAARHAALVKLFREAGCRSVTDAPVEGMELPNVLCTIRGTTDRMILVTAHYDMTGPGLGIGDNWGSASLLPTLHETFAGSKPRHTLVFIGFAEEEQGLIGAKDYLRDLAADGKLDDIAAMINMDGVGMASMRVWHTKSDAALLKHLKALARELKIDVTESSLDGAGIMDSFPFHQRGVPVLSLHGLAPGNYHRPHSRDDDWDAVGKRDLYDAYRLVARLVAELDSRPATPPAARSR